MDACHLWQFAKEVLSTRLPASEPIFLRPEPEIF